MEEALRSADAMKEVSLDLKAPNTWITRMCVICIQVLSGAGLEELSGDTHLSNEWAE